MFNNNIIPFIFAFLPVLLYSVLVYLCMAKSNIKWRISVLYFLMGIASTSLVNCLHFIFPFIDSTASTNFVLDMFIKAMIATALIEEGSKFAVFKITESYRNKNYPDHPFSIMFYAMSVSCGFAVLENILYAQAFGATFSMMDVLIIRSLSSVIVHMSTGLLLGYFVALGRMKSDNPKNRNIIYTFIGVMAATLYHGIYDFNLFVYTSQTQRISNVIVILGIVLSVFMIRHLKIRSTSTSTQSL